MHATDDNQDSIVTTVRTVKTFSERYKEFPEGSLRHLIFESKQRESTKGPIPGNGFAPAFLRLGRKILIDEVKFFEILKSKQSAK